MEHDETDFEGDSPPYLAGDIARLNRHYEGCWLNGPRHWQCAVAEANRQRRRAETAEAKLAATPVDDICRAIAGMDVGDGGKAKSAARDWLDSLIASEVQP